MELGIAARDVARKIGGTMEGQTVANEALESEEAEAGTEPELGDATKGLNDPGG